jgi:hypothetical protein
MNKIPKEGIRIRHERTGEEFVILPAKQQQEETTLTKVLAILFIGLMLTVATTVVCRGVRKLLT